MSDLPAPRRRRATSNNQCRECVSHVKSRERRSLIAYKRIRLVTKVQCFYKAVVFLVDGDIWSCTCDFRNSPQLCPLLYKSAWLLVETDECSWCKLLCFDGLRELECLCVSVYCVNFKSLICTSIYLGITKKEQNGIPYQVPVCTPVYRLFRTRTGTGITVWQKLEYPGTWYQVWSKNSFHVLTITIRLTTGTCYCYSIKTAWYCFDPP